MTAHAHSCTNHSHHPRPRLTSYGKLNYDPTRTTTLRNSFSREMGKRFRELRGVIRKAIVDEDVFALGSNSGSIRSMPLTTQQMTTPGPRAFNFRRSADKIEAFHQWLRAQHNEGILRVVPGQARVRIGSGIESRWTDLYIDSAYQEGVRRSRQEMIKAGYNVPDLDSSGGIQAAMNQPIHADRVGVLYTRAFNDLRGITDQMDTQISRVLAQAMAEGRNPRDIARLINRTISGPVGDLGLTDTLGRFIPAERRARMLARTEVIRAHHQANIQEMENWGAEGVTVKAEWTTAGFGVCPICLGYEGSTYDLNTARGMLPAHPNCRCVMIPTEPQSSTRRRRSRTRTQQGIAQTATDAKWTSLESVSVIKQAMKEKYNVSKVTGLTRNSNMTVIRQADMAADTIGNDIYAKLDKLRDMAIRKNNKSKIKQFGFDSTSAPKGAPSSRTLAWYSARHQEIRVGQNSFRVTADRLEIGLGDNWYTGGDFKSTIRHEFGHHVHMTLLEPGQRARWNRFANAKGMDYFKKNVSVYGASDPYEAFAESFAAYTSPRYRATSPGGHVLPTKKLPGDIEKLMEDLVGRRNDL